MNKSTLFLRIYTSLLFAGGLAGYFLGNSVPSLILGITSTFFLLLFSETKIFGDFYKNLLVLMTLGALDGFFSWRFAMTHKFMPAGLFSLLSFGMFLLFFWGIKKKAAGPTRH